MREEACVPTRFQEMIQTDAHPRSSLKIVTGRAPERLIAAQHAHQILLLLPGLSAHATSTVCFSLIRADTSCLGIKPKDQGKNCKESTEIAS